eukprot:CAMPEP_0180426624 /NCGR_PEP_ID=MMETSP1036_2-20121128/5891_1 /TAXON_ID=632150 /ORGANISM="Azadinium spinosum, Strain 3D9" /LENGTH=64 /DNA_ID=CAMNT_0022432183 /DNA_START=148 /DNA_END=342 /DNA_ORIENTATION=+
MTSHFVRHGIGKRVPNVCEICCTAMRKIVNATAHGHRIYYAANRSQKQHVPGAMDLLSVNEEVY